MSVSANISECHQVKDNHHQQYPMLIQLVMDLNGLSLDVSYKLYKGKEAENSAKKEKSLEKKRIKIG